MNANGPRRKLWDFPAAAQNIEDSFRPEDLVSRLLPGEEPQLEIYMAWYRDIFGGIVLNHLNAYLLLAVIVTFVTAVATTVLNLHQGLIFVPILLFFTILLLALHQRILYRQYRLLKTNARFIISIPQPNSFPLVDNIELKGLPTVIDPNWSKSYLWRLFQFTTGARDVYISLVPYQFVEDSAKVGGALVFPDMMPEDIFNLTRIVFPVPT